MILAPAQGLFRPPAFRDIGRHTDNAADRAILLEDRRIADVEQDLPDFHSRDDRYALERALDGREEFRDVAVHVGNPLTDAFPRPATDGGKTAAVRKCKNSRRIDGVQYHRDMGDNRLEPFLGGSQRVFHFPARADVTRDSHQPSRLADLLHQIDARFDPKAALPSA